MDPARPRATAVAVAGGRIAGVGDDPSELADGVRAGNVIDLKGATLIPGFHDAHNHMIGFGLSLTEVDLRAGSLDELYARVAARAAATPAGEWIIGAGYDQNKTGAHPHRDALDRVAPGHRVWLKHTSGHMCVVNSLVLRDLGIDASAPHVDGGRVATDAGGRPTGLLEERAQELVGNLTRPVPAHHADRRRGRRGGGVPEGGPHLRHRGGGRRRLGRPVPGRARRLRRRPRAGPAARPRRADGGQRRLPRPGRAPVRRHRDRHRPGAADRLRRRLAPARPDEGLHRRVAGRPDRRHVRPVRRREPGNSGLPAGRRRPARPPRSSPRTGPAGGSPRTRSATARSTSPSTRSTPRRQGTRAATRGTGSSTSPPPARTRWRGPPPSA